ncbi:MAG: trypsin-like peptidase domain-containing protein [Planctomycetaceae bacterium]|nr:trypsin-like peptidase domain-containing protein [Planctomycetaceae bacterium]
MPITILPQSQNHVSKSAPAQVTTPLPPDSFLSTQFFMKNTFELSTIKDSDKDSENHPDLPNWTFCRIKKTDYAKKNLPSNKTQITNTISISNANSLTSNENDITGMLRFFGDLCCVFFRGMIFRCAVFRCVILFLLFCFPAIFTGIIETEIDSDIARKIGVCSFAKLTEATAAASDNRLNWVVRADEKNRNAVVCIQGDRTDDSGEFSKDSGKTYNGMGTGIIIDERGYIVTNYHVVDKIRKIQVMTYNRDQYIARLVERDLDTDLAVIKIDARNPLQTIHFGHSDDLMPGENCMAIGNPYGYPFTVTDGRISGLGREVEVNDRLIYRGAIQTSAQINPGNSGGPLINVDGEMIGINAAIRQGAECIAFAIPVDQVVDVAAKLLENQVSKSVYLGVKVDQRDVALSKPLGKRNYKVVIKSVTPRSPAAVAGLQVGDVVTNVRGITLENKLDFYRALLDVRTNDDLAFGIVRDNTAMDIAVTLSPPNQRREEIYTSRKYSMPEPNQAVASPKNANNFAPKNKPKQDNKPRGFMLDELVWDVLGIRYTPMPMDEYKRVFAQNVQQFPYGGVVVDDVRESSPFAEKGILAGDVIVGIHEWSITSQNDVRFIAREWQNLKTPDNEVILLLFRGNILYSTKIPTK